MPTLFTMNADRNTFSGAGIVGAEGTEVFFDLNIADADELKVAEAPRTSFLEPLRVVGYIRSDGRMYDTKAVSPAPYDLTDPGALGVRLLANDPDFHLTNDVTYHVSGSRVVNGRTRGIVEFDTTAVPATDTAVNLADYYAGPGEPVVGGPDIPPDSVGIAQLSATGTPSATTYLRGDNTWGTPAGGGGGSSSWPPTGTPTALTTGPNVANGYPVLDGTGKVAAAQLPSYVDDVLDFANLAAFPGTGSTGIIYVADDAGLIYRWSGSAYVNISASPGSTDAVPEGSTNKYYTDARAQAANASAIAAAVSTAATAAASASKSADTIVDGSTNKAYAAADKTKLATIPLAISTARGVNSSGAEFATTASTLPGTYGTDYSYDSAQSFTYYAAQGHKIVRLPFRWERIQPTMNAALNTTELGRLTAAVANIQAAGMQAVLDVHNYGRFINSTANGGATLTLGTDFTSSPLVDLWTRLSTAFKGNTGVYAYGLMNEPHDFNVNPGTFSGTTRYDWNDATLQGWGGESGCTTTNVSSQMQMAATATAGSFNYRANDNKTNRTPTTGNYLQATITLAAGTAGSWSVRLQWQNSSYQWQTAASTTYVRTDTNAVVSGLIAGVPVAVTANFTANAIVSGSAFAVELDATSATAGAVTALVDNFAQGSVTGAQTGAQVWETASQAVVTAIRGNSDSTLIMVPGYNYSGAQNWSTTHPTPWITGSNIKYEAHYYFDTGNGGTYANTYATENSTAVTNGYASLTGRATAEMNVFLGWLSSNGVKGFLGEFGWPNTGDTTNWNIVGAALYALLDAAGVDAAYWAAGERWGTTYNLSVYTGTPEAVKASQAVVVEAHPSTYVVPAGGSAGGDLIGSYPNPTLPASGVTAGSYTNASVTVDAKGRVTSASSGAGGGSGNMNTTTYDAAGIAQQVVGLTAAQTLTNKTLTTPVLGGATVTDATDIALGTATGTRIGTASTQKLGFYGATPGTQPSGTADLGTLLAGLGLRASGSYTLSTGGTASFTGLLNGGNYQAGVSNLTAATTLGTTYGGEVQYCNATTAAFNVTPAATTTAGYRWLIIKTDSSANAVTVVGTVGGQANWVLANQYDYVWIISTTTSGTFQVASASKVRALATARTINGVSFDGTANITVPAIARTILSISTATTLAATASTDYVYKLTASAAVPTLPTAISNTNMYTLKNTSGSTIAVATTSSQTIDGSTTYSLPTGSAIDLVSDNANWMVV